MVQRRRRSSRYCAARWFFAVFVLRAGAAASGKRVNQTYYMDGAFCGSEATVVGATVFSHLQWPAHRPAAAAAAVTYGHNTDCTIVFRAHRDNWRLLLRFDYIDIPDRAMNQQLCRDAVYAYDSNVVGTRAMKAAGGNAGLCGDAIPPAVSSTGRYLTVYFRSDAGGRSGRGFKFTLTAFSDESSCGNSSFKCGDDKCIDEELACDGVQHCADASDEGDAPSSGGCFRLQATVPPEMKARDEEASRTVWDDFLELGIAACVGIVGGTLVVIILLVICVACTCKKCLNRGTDVQPRRTAANSSNAGLLPPQQVMLSATPTYKPAPWAGSGQPPQSHNPHGVHGYFPLTPHNGNFLPQPAQPSVPETVFSPHVHRESYSMHSGSYGTPKSVGGGSSSAFAQPMHTRPTGPTPRSYTPTTTLSSRSGGSSTVTYPHARPGVLSQL